MEQIVCLKRVGSGQWASRAAADVVAAAEPRAVRWV